MQVSVSFISGAWGLGPMWNSFAYPIAYAEHCVKSCDPVWVSDLRIVPAHALRMCRMKARMQLPGPRQAERTPCREVMVDLPILFNFLRRIAAAVSKDPSRYSMKEPGTGWDHSAEYVVATKEILFRGIRQSKGKQIRPSIGRAIYWIR